MEMKMTTTGNDGKSAMTATMLTSIKGSSALTETNINMNGAQIKQVTLVRGSKPDKIYTLNRDTKTYTEIDLSKMSSMMMPGDEDYEVKKIGSEKIQGFNCTRVQVKMKKSQTTIEMWTTKDALDWATYTRMQQNPAFRDSKLTAALRNAEADGMAMKIISTAADGSKSVMEVVKVERKSLPASLFEIPKDYKKSDEMFGIPGMTQEKMQEMMKQMKQLQEKK